MRRVAHLADSSCVRSLKSPIVAEGDGVTCPRCRRRVRWATAWERYEQVQKAGFVIRAAFPAEELNLVTVARCLVAIARAHPEEMETERVLVALRGKQ